MGETTGELEQQIQDQRVALGRDLDALGDKVSPRRIVDRRKDAIRSRAQSVKTRAMGTASDMSDRANPVSVIQSGQEFTRREVAGAPLAAGATAFAAGLVAAVIFPGTEPEHALAANVQPLAEGAAANVSDMAQQSAQNLKPAVQDAVATVKDQAQSAAEAVKGQSGDA